MGSKERKRRRKILKYAAYTAGALGAAYLGKKLYGGLVKKGESGDVTDDTSPDSGEGGFSDSTEEGLVTPQQAGVFGGMMQNPMMLLAIGAVALMLFYKRK